MPEIAVLLPLQEARGAGADSLRAWSHGQTLARDRYELVLLAAGEDPSLEESVRCLLAEHDRWIEHRTPNEYELFNLGARETSARFVFLTEVHCVPEPDCLEQMLAHLHRTGQVGARGRSIGVAHGKLGALERKVYEEAMALGTEEDHWNKVLIHSLAIDRDAFNEVGGFDRRYGDFSGWALALALRHQGHRLGSFAGAAVRHHYTGELPELLDHVRDFAHSEMRFWDETPPEVTATLLEAPEEWTRRRSVSAEGARRLLRALVAARIPRALLSRTGRSLAAHAVLGSRASFWPAALKLRWWRARMRLEALRPRPSERVYRRMWEAGARAGRWEYLAATEASPRSGATHEELLLGFYPGETLDGVGFRWTGPVAIAEVAVPAGPAREVIVEMLPAGGLANGRGVRVLVDGRAVRHQAAEDRLSFEVPGGRVSEIAFVAAPLPGTGGRHDARELGIPVRRLRVV